MRGSCRPCCRPSPRRTGAVRRRVSWPRPPTRPPGPCPLARPSGPRRTVLLPTYSSSVSLERSLESKVDRAAILEQRLRTVGGDAGCRQGTQLTEVVHVLHVEAVLVVDIQSQARRPAAGVFVAAGAHGRVAV